MASKIVQVKRQIDATAGQVAKVLFLAAKPPDPSKRIIKRPQQEKPEKTSASEVECG